MEKRSPNAIKYRCKTSAIHKLQIPEDLQTVEGKDHYTHAVLFVPSPHLAIGNQVPGERDLLSYRVQPLLCSQQHPERIPVLSSFIVCFWFIGLEFTYIAYPAHWVEYNGAAFSFACDYFNSPSVSPCAAWGARTRRFEEKGPDCSTKQTTYTEALDLSTPEVVNT